MENENDEPQNTQSNVTLCPNAKTGSPSHDSAPISNQQQQPSIVNWPYMPQNATEQFLSMHFLTQTPSPGAYSQWQQFLQGQLFAQSTPPFWQPQLTVSSGSSLGANVPTIAPSSTTHTLVPNICYPYPFPGFSGLWNPSSCLGQLYQMQHPYVYSFPGALTSSPAPSMPGCTASAGHSFQGGIIKQPATLPREYQQLWEAQSVENVQLRSMIHKLQAEVSDYMDRIKKLEEEVSSLKQEVPTNKVIGTVPVGTRQPSKRGRPKQSWAPLDSLHESHPKIGTRKPVLNNTQFMRKSPIFEKVILKKVENKEIPFGSTTTMVQRENNEKILNAVKDVSCNIQINEGNPIMSAYHGQDQACGSGPALSFPSGVNVNFGKDRHKELKPAYSELPQPDKVLKDSVGGSAKYTGNTGNGTSGIPSQDTAKDVLDGACQSFFHKGNFIQQGGKITTGCNFSNEEEDAIVESGNNENQKEMGDDTSSSAEESGVIKDFGVVTTDHYFPSSPNMIGLSLSH